MIGFFQDYDRIKTFDLELKSMVVWSIQNLSRKCDKADIELLQTFVLILSVFVKTPDKKLKWNSLWAIAYVTDTYKSEILEFSYNHASLIEEAKQALRNEKRDDILPGIRILGNFLTMPSTIANSIVD